MSTVLTNASIEPINRVLWRKGPGSPIKERGLLEVLHEAKADRELEERIREARERHESADGTDSNIEGLARDLPPKPSITFPNLVVPKNERSGADIQKLMPVEVPLYNPKEARKCREKLIEELGDHALHIGLNPEGDDVRAFILVGKGQRFENFLGLFSEVLRKGFVPNIPWNRVQRRYTLSSDPDDLLADSFEDIEPFRGGQSAEGFTDGLELLIQNYAIECYGAEDNVNLNKIFGQLAAEKDRGFIPPEQV